MFGWLARWLRGMFAGVETDERGRTEDEVFIEGKALQLFHMGPRAAGGVDSPSPGTPSLLARGRDRTVRELEPLLEALAAGVSRSAAAALARGLQAEQLDRARQRREEVQGRVWQHRRDEPDPTSRMAQALSERWTRWSIIVVLIIIEELITAPGLAAVFRGEKTLGFVKDSVLAAGVLAVFVFIAAEAVARLTNAWLDSREPAPHNREPAAEAPVDEHEQDDADPTRDDPNEEDEPAPPWPSRVLAWARTRLHRRHADPAHAAGRPRGVRTSGLIALTSALAVLFGTFGTLAWLAGARQTNEDVVAARIAAAAPTGALGDPAGGSILGLAAPATGATGASGATGPGGASPGLAGLFAEGAASRKQEPSQDTAADVGPLGAISVVAFLVACATATLGYRDAEHRDWRELLDELLASEDAAGREHRDVERRTDEEILAQPANNQAYDQAARRAADVIYAGLQQVHLWEAEVRADYEVTCARSGRTPVALRFPPVPEPDEETARILGRIVPDGHQGGATGHGFQEAPAQPAPGPGAEGPPEPETDPPPPPPASSRDPWAEPGGPGDDTPPPDPPPAVRPTERAGTGAPVRSDSEIADGLADLLGGLDLG